MKKEKNIIQMIIYSIFWNNLTAFIYSNFYRKESFFILVYFGILNRIHNL